MKILSLLPAATDTVIEFGLVSQIVGRSHECDAVSVAHIPSCTESKYGDSEDTTPIQVHETASAAGSLLWESGFGTRSLTRVASLIEWGLSPYRTNALLIKELNPDIILTQVQSYDGATCPDDMLAALHEWLGQPVKLVHMDPQNLDDIWADMLLIGSEIAAETAAEAAVSRLKMRMDVVRGVTLGRAPKRVACIQWIEPLFLAGAWIPQLVKMAGGVDLSTGLKSTKVNSGLYTGEEDGGSAMTSLGAVQGLNPQAVVFAVCGCNLRESVEQVKKFLVSGGIHGWIEAGVGVFVVDAAKLFSRPGPSLVESLEVLAEVLHPEVQPFGHYGHWWCRLET